MKDGGTKRQAVAKSMIESLGGRLEALYFTFGDTDVLAIADLPDNTAAAAASLTLGASGMVACKTRALLTAAEIDGAVKKSVSYTPPGK
jgi:uncharacterized protein with GYD domain